MPLDDPKLDDLVSLIRDSFRVREDHDPVYVDVSGHLKRVSAAQFQVLFGRRGSGKSCLLVHYNKISESTGTSTVYVGGDIIKRLRYPDLLVSLVLQVLEGLPNARPNRLQRFLRRKHPLSAQIEGLRSTLDTAETAKVQEQQTQHWTDESDARVGKGPINAGVKESVGGSSGLNLEYTAEKLDTLERHLGEYAS